MIHTEQPKLVDRAIMPRDPGLQDLLRALSAMHGAGVVVQNSDGGMTPIRFNTVTAKLEYYDGAEWAQI